MRRDSSADWLINKFRLTVWSVLIIPLKRRARNVFSERRNHSNGAPKFDTSNISSLLRVPGTRGFTQTHRCQISGCQVWSLSTCLAAAQVWRGLSRRCERNKENSRSRVGTAWVPQLQLLRNHKLLLSCVFVCRLNTEHQTCQSQA